MKAMSKFMVVGLVLLFAGCKWFSCCSKHSCDCSACAQKGCEKDCKCEDCAKGECGRDCHCDCCKKVEPVKKGIEAIKHITSLNEFNDFVKNATKPVVVDFSAKWCGACQVLKPTYEAVANELSDKFSFASVDVDEAGDVANNFGIKGIPTIFFFKNGQKVGQPIVGAVNKAKLIDTIHKVLD